MKTFRFFLALSIVFALLVVTAFSGCDLGTYDKRFKEGQSSSTSE